MIDQRAQDTSGRPRGCSSSGASSPLRRQRRSRAIKAALEPYKTPDGGYGYALEPDGRGPTSQPPHIWTALEALDDAGDDRRRASATTSPRITAPDGGMPVALPTLEPYAARAVVGDRDRGHAARHRAALRAALEHGDAPVARRAPRRSAGRAVDAIEKTHPYEVEAAITFLDAAPRPRRGRRARPSGSARLVREQGLVGAQPEGYSPGEIHHPHDFAKRPDSLARAVVQRRRDRGEPRPPGEQQREHGGWADHVGASGRPRSRSSGAGW